MKLREKYRIIRVPADGSNDESLKDQYSCYLYNSKSFLIRYYAYLPFVFSLKYIRFSEHSRVLDIGCADGPFLPTLNQYARSIVANDINEEFIRESKNLVDNKLKNVKKINLACSDGQALPFRDNKFDLVFCLEVLEHVKNPDQFINEVFRVLRRNGILICTLPVEIGISLLIRTMIGKMVNFKRPKYGLKELIRIIILKRPKIRPEYIGHKEYARETGHKNFDWRVIKRKIGLRFKIIRTRFVPINFLKDINPIVLIKAIKNS
ncbi:MAG: class I SAM-dependent methyltransferase [Candidatus Hodarchaeota archaeon]